jgi:nucleoid DNA-binding protein
MEKQISIVINELLYNHDCVIIPGFGGFVSRQISAQINFNLNTITPPSKSVLFNKNLVNNDGLLANSLIEKLNISYADAIIHLNKYTENCHKSLHQNLRLEIENIGVLYLDLEKNIQFEPKENLNFAMNSFGLTTLYAQQFTSDELSSNKKEVNFKDRKVKSESKKRPFSNTIKKVSFSILTLLIIGLAFLLSTNVAPKNSYLASINPFTTKELPHYKEIKFETTKITEKNKTETPSINEDLKKIVFGYVNEAIEKNNAVITEKKQSIIGKYEVIIGCFKEKSNAERLINKLNTDNINAGISGVNAKGLFIVSTGGFDTKNSAEILLNNVRRSFPSAWVKCN